MSSLGEPESRRRTKGKKTKMLYVFFKYEVFQSQYASPLRRRPPDKLLCTERPFPAAVPAPQSTPLRSSREEAGVTPGDPTPRQACPPEPRGPEAYPCLPPSSPHQGEHLSPRLRSLGELTPA
ncbi:uncharacterized protein LOC144293647 isoform X4 [Canis aureus]